MQGKRKRLFFSGTRDYFHENTTIAFSRISRIDLLLLCALILNVDIIIIEDNLIKDRSNKYVIKQLINTIITLLSYKIYILYACIINFQ